ncbi:MAG: SDR family oxidoreductase [Candidatus Hermodarchaeota archaeon]
MKKLLIIGVSGLTGNKLAELSNNNYEVYGTYNKRPLTIDKCESFPLDKTNKEKTQQLLTEINPDVIIDCSALHNVDYCETHQEETWNVNVEGTMNIANMCKAINARFIFISTDYVFDGRAKQYNEESETNPLNYYGISKLKAEEKISQSGIDYVIARTSLVFGWNPGELEGKTSSSGKTMNFVIWALNKLRKGESLSIVTDQYSTPTLADNLAEYLLSLANSSFNGIIHTAGRECINRYEFTLKIADIFDIDKELITPVTSDMFKQASDRPMRCCLDVSKALRLLKVKPLTIDEALLTMKEQEYYLHSLR